MTVEWDLLIFLFIAAVTIISAIMIIWSKEIVRSVMWLTLAFLCVGMVYIFLNAEYLAIIQIMIYVGAVAVLMLFGIMLTKRRLLGGERNE
ncbi:MAG: NADH-quinone oxidoreductase subunit J [Methanomassiliicoccus sp.]|nr:NADH-quinone oxidoreductase subunit J [Methanomassiliicoccus sp.]